MKFTILALISLLAVVGCGKKDKSSGSGGFSVQSLYTAETRDGEWVVPNGLNSTPFILIGGQQYYVARGTTQEALRVLSGMYQGTSGIQPRVFDANGRRYLIRVTACVQSTTGSSACGLGTPGSQYGQQYPYNPAQVMSNYLIIQTVQPL